jgi:hypothetical protein
MDLTYTHPSQFSNLVETLIVTLRVHFFRILKFQLNCCVAAAAGVYLIISEAIYSSADIRPRLSEYESLHSIRELSTDIIIENEFPYK